MSDSGIEREMAWLDERFLKSFVRVHYLYIIERGRVSGYDIMQFVRETYRYKLSAATIYPGLQSLEKDGYIRGKWVEGRRHPAKKAYSLTSNGRRLLSAAKRRLREHVKGLKPLPRPTY